MAPRAAKKRQDRQAKLSADALKASRAIWAKVDANAIDMGMADSLQALTTVLTGAQERAAAGVEPYLKEVLGELGLSNDAVGAVNPGAFAGYASDGRDLQSLLQQPAVVAKDATKRGYSPKAGKDVGGRLLDRIVRTQVADAGRAAETTGMAARLHIPGYVRMVNLPACSRCIVLAGRYYKYHQGFKRHDGCDCVHIPCMESDGRDLAVDPQKAFKAGQVRGLTVAEREALDAGADLYQIVNAQRGMYEASRVPGQRRRRRVVDLYGQKVGITLEGATKRGTYGRSRKDVGTKRPRLTPESIRVLADGNREEMVRLLKLYSYMK